MTTRITVGRGPNALEGLKLSNAINIPNMATVVGRGPNALEGLKPCAVDDIPLLEHVSAAARMP